MIAQFARTILAPCTQLTVVRVPEGGSTIVYRIDTGERTYYLRILPEPDASFAPEVATHNRLREAGLHVPEVVFFEHYNGLFQRSLMLTTAIAGQAVGHDDPPAAIPQILHQAGRELAIINQVTVQGYGWIRRDSPDLKLWAEYPTLPQWLTEHFAEPIRALYQSSGLTSQNVDILLELLDTACQVFQSEASVLAHGDFDVTHIFYDDSGYTGVIDFGEIRGAHRLYDLGHFAFESSDLLPFLLQGHTEITPLGEDFQHDLYLTALLIAARRIGLCLLRERSPYPPDVVFVTRRLQDFGR
jgi:aminoglycoside phosphotransferase (APT) family kinase protein